MNKRKANKKRNYNNYKESFDKDKSIGLGDVVEKVAKVTGVKKVVEKIVGDDCGCKSRKERLNKIRFKYPMVRCFTEEQFNTWGDYKDKTEWTHKEQKEVLIPIYAQLFAIQLKPASCCLQIWIDDINRVYDKYN